MDIWKLLAALCSFALLFCDVRAATYKTKYITSDECPTSYGQELEQIASSSAISCSESCAAVAACRSFMFDPASRLCHINAEEATWFSDGCAAKVFYGRIEKATIRDQWMYEACSTSAQCTIPNSYCRAGTCVCSIGYPYTHRSDSCVTSCSTYGAQFSSHPGALAGYNNYEQSVTSVDTCHAICVAATSFTCRSIDFIPGPSFVCYFSSETAFTQPSAYYVDSYWTHLRNCA